MPVCRQLGGSRRRPHGRPRQCAPGPLVGPLSVSSAALARMGVGDTAPRAILTSRHTWPVLSRETTEATPHGGDVHSTPGTVFDIQRARVGKWRRQTELRQYLPVLQRRAPRGPRRTDPWAATVRRRGPQSGIGLRMPGGQEVYLRQEMRCRRSPPTVGQVPYLDACKGCG